MKLRILPICILIVFISIISMDIIAKTKYENIKVKIGQKEYEIFVPQGYKLNISSSIEENEYVFSYPDSSCIYIGDFFYTKNEPNIRSLGDSIYNLRYQNRSLAKETNALVGEELIPLRPDTLDLMGVQDNQLTWREIVINDFNIGYYNVSVSKIEIFNRALSSLKTIHSPKHHTKIRNLPENQRKQFLNLIKGIDVGSETAKKTISKGVSDKVN